MNYSPYAMLFALLAFLWSLMTYYKVDRLEQKQQETIQLIESVFNPDLSLPEEEVK